VLRSKCYNHSMIKLNSPYHHAYCFIGPRGYSKSVLEFLEREWQIKTVGNPDCFVLKYETFGIDESRELSLRSFGRAFSGEKKIFVVSLSVATEAAQARLYKFFRLPRRSRLNQKPLFFPVKLSGLGCGRAGPNRHRRPLRFRPPKSFLFP